MCSPTITRDNESEVPFGQGRTMPDNSSEVPFGMGRTMPDNALDGQGTTFSTRRSRGAVDGGIDNPDPLARPNTETPRSTGQTTDGGQGDGDGSTIAAPRDGGERYRSTLLTSGRGASGFSEVGGATLLGQTNSLRRRRRLGG